MEYSFCNEGGAINGGDGQSSCYGGTHESLGIVREFAGTISGEVDGTPYAGEFAEHPHGDHDHK